MPGIHLIVTHGNQAQSFVPKDNREWLEKWDAYFGEGKLEDYQRLCRDLDIKGRLTNVHKCRQALKGVFVNVPQFLSVTERPDKVKLFSSQDELRNWTKQKAAYFPEVLRAKFDPLSILLADKDDTD